MDSVHPYQGEEGRGAECVLTGPISRHTGRSYQDWLVKTPVSHSGLRMYSMVEISLMAVMGGLEQAGPRSVGGEGSGETSGTCTGPGGGGQEVGGHDGPRM